MQTAVQAELPVPVGDPGQLEAIFRQYHTLVLHTAYRVTGNPTDAEDVLQTVFLRLAQRPADLPPVAGIESYLYRAAVNCALDVVRGRSRIAGEPLDETIRQLSADPRTSPERVHSSAEIRTWLRHAIARLHPRTAEMFVLRYLEGKENPEIARMLKTSAAAVAVTLHRARWRLAAAFRAQIGGVL